MQKFAVGQAVRRREDERFLIGAGCYIDDIVLENMAHAAFVRSPHAHAKIKSIDIEQAKSATGVVAVLTHKDVKKAGLGELPTLDQVDGVDEYGIRVPPRHALTGDVVRFVGDPVAMVIAQTREQARDAAELIWVDYVERPAHTDLATALDKSAPVIWKPFESNRCYHFAKGDAQAVAKAIAGAHHVTSLDLINNRLAPFAIEPRGAIGDYLASEDQYILRVSGQAVHGQRGQMATSIFKTDLAKIRVIMPDVGGGFGAKNFVYPENVMVMLAAKLTGRPVKWIAERSENFMSEIHARDHVTRVDLALAEDGRFLALKVATLANMGAYLSSYATIIPSSASWVAMGGTYDIPAVLMEVDAVFTNTTPLDAYRGAGRPEASYLLERIVDVAAGEMGLDPVALRRRNFIGAFPHKSALGMTIDCGAFEQTLDIALGAADRAGFDGRAGAAAKRGKHRGFGVASYLEVTLGQPVDHAEVRFDHDGGVTILTGGASTGQGHETAYVQILSSQLGIESERIRYFQGDTGVIATGGGHGGSRSLAIVGNALLKATGEIKHKGIQAASHVLEAHSDDIEFRDGLFAVKGTNRQIGLFELEARLSQAQDLPDDTPATLTTRSGYERGAYNYPNGVHVAEVEVDGETGAVSLERYFVVDDFGRIVNPLIAEGQVIGGAVQGIGQALLECVVYDDAGQLITGSLMDYALPRADDLCAIDVSFNQNAPTKTNPLGVKGAGEAGATGAPPALVNAVVDALKDFGVTHIDMPLSPQKVWRAMHDA